MINIPAYIFACKLDNNHIMSGSLYSALVASLHVVGFCMYLCFYLVSKLKTKAT